MPSTVVGDERFNAQYGLSSSSREGTYKWGCAPASILLGQLTCIGYCLLTYDTLPSLDLGIGLLAR